jgi:hypothetical protein
MIGVTNNDTHRRIHDKCVARYSERTTGEVKIPIYFSKLGF